MSNTTVSHKNTGDQLTANELNNILDAVNSKADTGEIGIKGDKGDTGIGVPNGGSTGQLLAKTSDADQATGWITPSGGGGGTTPPVWLKKGTVLRPTLATDELTLQEATVMYEGSPQVLVNVTGSVFKLWFTQGYGTPNIVYAESLDGINWVRSTAICVTNHARSAVLKVGSNYYMYASLGTAGAQIDRYTSTDGVAWTLANSAVITKGIGSAWNSASVANICVFYDTDDTTWKMILEANSTAGSGVFSLGYYTSPDGITWMPYATNPVIAVGGRTWGGAYVKKIAGVYWMWCHGGPSTGLALPTDLYRFHSTDMINWTMAPTVPIMERVMADEGVSTNYGQLADPTLLEIAGKTYMWYSASPDGSAQSGAHLKMSIADMTIADLIATNEGDGDKLQIAQIDAYDRASSDLRYLKPGAIYQDGPLYLESVFDAIRMRNKNTPANLSLLYPEQLLFIRGGINNSIVSANYGLTLGAGDISGTWTFTNGSGIQAVIDETGVLKCKGLFFNTLPPNDLSGGSSLQFLAVTSTGNVVKIPGTNLRKVFYGNNTSTSLSNSTIASSIIPAGNGSLNLAAWSVLVGNIHVIKFGGVYSTPATPGTFTINIAVSGVTIATCTLSALASSASNLQFNADIKIVTTGIGTAGSAIIEGYIDYSIGDNAAPLRCALNNGGAVKTSSSLFDYPGTLGLTGKWDTADSAKVFKVNQFSVEKIN